MAAADLDESERESRRRYLAAAKKLPSVARMAEGSLDWGLETADAISLQHIADAELHFLRHNDVTSVREPAVESSAGRSALK